MHQKVAFQAVVASDERIARVLGERRLAQLKEDLAEIIEMFGGSVPARPPEL